MPQKLFLRLILSAVCWYTVAPMPSLAGDVLTANVAVLNVSFKPNPELKDAFCLVTLVDTTCHQFWAWVPVPPVGLPADKQKLAVEEAKGFCSALGQYVGKTQVCSSSEDRVINVLSDPNKHLNLRGFVDFGFVDGEKRGFVLEY